MDATLITRENARKGIPAAFRLPRVKRLAMTILFLIGIYLGLAAAIAWNTVRAKRSRHDVTPTVYGLSFESVRFHSADRTELSGWLIPVQHRGDIPNPKKPRGIVVLCHGIDSTRNAMLPVARMLVRSGFAVLLFDFRARGESGGARSTIGFRETHDLLAAIQYVRNRPELSALPIGVLGESMGAAVAIMGAARSPEVAAVVAESPFAVLSSALDNHFRLAFGPLGPVMGAPVRWFGERLTGLTCNEIAPLREISKVSPRPVLLIQDADDGICPPSETKALIDSTVEGAQLWTVPSSGHIGARITQPEEYERRITGFFRMTLQARND